MKKFLDNLFAILVMIGISLACLIPTWLFLLIYFLLNPQGYWQKFVLYGVGIYFLGAFQVVGLVILVGLWIAVLKDWIK